MIDADGQLAPQTAAEHDENFLDFWCGYARTDGAELRRNRQLTRMVTDIPATLFNGVFHSALAPGDVAAAAAEAVALGAAHGVPVLWRVTPTTAVGTAAALEAIGWQPAGTAPVMLTTLPTTVEGREVPLPDRSVTIETVTASTLDEWSRTDFMGFGFPEDFTEYARTLDRAYGEPGDTRLVRFLARVDGEAAATSALLPGPTLGGIYSVATLPEHRGSGLGTAMTLTAMRAARDAGCAAAVLQASTMGQPVYERLGFRVVGSIDEFRPPAG